jgi:nucleolar protein 12
VVPKGDPSLGDRLRGLDKESRRAIKTADADRVARRVAKKKAKHTMEKDIAKLEGSIKERPRKKSGAGGKLKPKTKTRMRSDKSLAKKNVKK